MVRFIQPCCENMYGWIKCGYMTLWRTVDGKLSEGLAGCKGPGGIQVCHCPYCGKPIVVIGTGEEPDWVEIDKKTEW